MTDEIVRLLAETCSRASIIEARDAVFRAHLANVREPTIVTAVSFENHSTTFQVGASPAERLQFLSQCRAALNLIDGHSATPANGVKLDFSTRFTST